MYLCLGLKPLSPFVIITVHSLRPPEAHLEEVLSNAEISSKVQARVSKRQMQQAIEQSPPPKQLDQIREKVSRVQWQMPATRWRAHTHAAREGRGGACGGVLEVCSWCVYIGRGERAGQTQRRRRTEPEGGIPPPGLLVISRKPLA